MNERKKNIADSLKPTYENVVSHFLVKTMNEILFGDDYPNFRFDFREQEAIEYISEFYQNYPNGVEYYGDRFAKILNMLTNQEDARNNTISVMVVSDYKSFFEGLRQYYSEVIDLYWKRTTYTSFPVYEMENCFTDIWLRATPDDFNNPENFLKKQVLLAKDKTLEKYDEEVSFGRIPEFGDNVLCVKNGYARTWDEALREFQITIYDKEHYDNEQLIYKPQYTLPVIRYGVYENNGKKVCYIGSIQDNSNLHSGGLHDVLKKKVERSKYRVNQNIDGEEIQGIEPKQVIALSVFFNLLSREGITEYEIPSLPVLDYDYHIKRNEKLLRKFNERWDAEMIEGFPSGYARDKSYLERNYGKEDLVSKIKTERLMKTMVRMLQHYPKGQVTSYPDDADSMMYLHIPKIKNKDDINGELLQRLYQVTSGKREIDDIEF